MYKKGDHIAFMSKQPHFHLNEMFGHNHLTVDDYEKEEYVGIILSVIGNGIYTAKTISPLKGFFCIVSEDDILRPIGISELSLLNTDY